MTTTLVTGATGRLGTPTVARLRATGHQVRALSRRRGAGLTTGDLLTGAGIDEALAGVETVVHLATGPSGKGDVQATRRLLDAARTAQVEHVVLISIVGIDEIPLPYYRDKVVIERLVHDSGIPCSVLRATQFHAFIEAIFRGQRRSPVILAPVARLQPIAVGDVADRLTELVDSSPAGRVPDIGGPEVHDLLELARAWARTTGTRRPVLPLWLPGKTFAAYRSGAALVPGPPYGRRTFTDHLLAGPGSPR